MNQLTTMWKLLFWTALTVSPFVHAQDLSSVFNQTRLSVVEIHVTESVVQGTKNRQINVIPSQGSGVLVSGDGKVFTVAHLVQTADTIAVQTESGEIIPAKVIASEPAADIALLQLERIPAGMSPATLGNSDEVKTGQQIFIVGAPYGLNSTMTVGHIGGLHHPESPYGAFQPIEMFKIDAGMDRGSSGAPLFDTSGKLIGIATQVVTTDGHESLGFTVAINTAKALLLERHSLWTGIDCYWLAGGLAQALNLPQSSGLLVQRIASHSPASRMGLQAGTAAAKVGDDVFILGGDVVLAMQGISLAEERGYERARAALAALKHGDTLHFTVLRASERIELRTTIAH